MIAFRTTSIQKIQWEKILYDCVLHHFFQKWSLSRKIDNIYKMLDYFTQDYSPEIVFGHL